MQRYSIIALIASVTLLVSSMGCATGSSSTQKRNGPSESKSTDKQPPPETPTPEELKGSPCGNPDWARLPDRQQQSDDDAAEDGADQQPESKDSPVESSKETGKHRSTTDSYACRPAE